MLNGYAGARNDRIPDDAGEIRLAALYDYCRGLGAIGAVQVHGDREATQDRPGSGTGRDQSISEGVNTRDGNLKFQCLNSDIPTGNPAPQRRSWWGRLMLWRRRLEHPEYDETLHEVRAARVRASESASELREAVKPLQNAPSPFFALASVIINQQAMKPDDDNSSSEQNT